MRTYNYTFYDKKAHIGQGFLQAYSLDDAKKILTQQKITLIKIEEYDAVKKTAKIEKKETIFSRISVAAILPKKLNYDEFVIFLREFMVLIRSGIGIMNALEILSSQVKDKNFKKALIKISQEIYDGSSLYNAFGRQKFFPKLFINLLHAGEISGDLPKILNDLSEYYEKERELKKKAMSALTYPIIVLAVALGGVFFLVGYIFPSFIDIYKSFDVALPLTTKILIFVVNMLRNPIIAILLLAMLTTFIMFLKTYLNTPVGRYYFDGLMLRIPIISNITKKITLARFARTLGTVYENGLSLHQSLEISAEIAENTYYKKEFENILKRIEDEGILLSSAVSAKYSLFPKIFVNLVAAGEESGDLGNMLKKVSTYFEEEVYYIFDNLLNLLEPFIIIILGSIVLFIMLSLFLPLYTLITKFSGS